MWKKFAYPRENGRDQIHQEQAYMLFVLAIKG